LSPECKTAAARAAATLLLLGAIAGCSILKNNVEAQALVDQRVVGMQVGDFFERYGRWSSRSEQADGSAEYGWVSAISATVSAGVYGPDERTCTLRIVAAKNGRITLANILQDMPGRTSTSRCTEVFKAA
jgi:hypothetical protein